MKHLLCCTESETPQRAEWTGRMSLQILPGNVSCEHTSYSGKIPPVLSLTCTSTVLPPQRTKPAPLIAKTVMTFLSFLPYSYNSPGSSAKVISAQPTPFFPQKTFEGNKIQIITGDSLKQQNQIFLTEQTPCPRYKMSNTNKHFFFVLINLFWWKLAAFACLQKLHITVGISLSQVRTHLSSWFKSVIHCFKCNKWATKA